MHALALVVIKNVHRVVVKFQFQRCVVADDAYHTLAGGFARNKILRVNGVHAVFIVHQHRAAVLVAGVNGKATAVGHAVPIPIGGHVAVTFRAGCAFGAIGAVQAGRVIPFEDPFGGHGAKIFHVRLAQQEGNQIQIVGSLLQKQAAGFVIVAVPAVVIAAPVGHIVASLHLADRSEHTGGYDLSGPNGQRCGTQREGHDGFVVHFFENGAKAVGVFFMRANGLFQKNGYAVFCVEKRVVRVQ